ncbi:MAG: diguanylate cyclase regulator RdcB family protein [bacterium]|nr:diguanylate cyclase regulator RdcB family protein [bacterium]
MAARKDAAVSRGDSPAEPLSVELLDDLPQVREKAVIEVVNNLEVVDDRLRVRDENPASFLERAWDLVTGASSRRQQAVDRGVQGVLRGMNEWLHGLQAAQVESDIALARVAERLQETRDGVMKLQKRHQELKHEVEALDRRLADHIACTEHRLSELQQALAIEGSRNRAWNAVAAAKERLLNNRFKAVPPLLRVLLTANDLYWNDFGRFLRLKGPDDKDARDLIDHARNVLGNMAADFAVGEERESFIVDRWLDPLRDAALPTDWRDAIAYLLDDASPGSQPLAVSARMRLLDSKEELPHNRPRLAQPFHLGAMAMRETVRRIEMEWLNREGAAR